MKKFFLICLFALLFSLPLSVHGQVSSDLLKEYLFPIQYTGAVNADVIGLRIYKNNLENQENKDPLTWYKDNVANAKATLPAITADGYRGVRDDRTVYIQAANWADLADANSFYTNIYVLAYNQNASADTVDIFNQMVTNIKFNKNIMDLYCLKSQYEAVKDRFRRDTIRKSDYYTIRNIFSHFSGSLDLGAGTYVPNMSLSTWPSWQDTLGKQLGVTLPVDPLNIMAVNPINCTSDADCGTGQCSGNYCSLCQSGYNPKTCWNEIKKDYQPVDGFVYKYQNGVLTIRYEYPQILFPASNGGCIIGCNQGGLYYSQGACLTNASYCDTGEWKPNTCGDKIIRCNEVCDPALDTNCRNDCTGCLGNYHSVGSLCEADTRVSTVSPRQTLSVGDERQRWTGSGWSDPYATACKPNAMINNQGKCVCNANFHEVGGSCEFNTQVYNCLPAKPDNSVWNMGANQGSYTQTWDGSKWLPINTTTIYNQTATTTACHFICASGFAWDNTSCNAIPPPVTYSCTGTDYSQVAHAVFCPGSNATDLTANVANTLVATCSNNPAKCEYTCGAGYHIEGSACVLTVCIGDATQSCTIAHGAGQQIRACTNPPAWDAWGACTVLSCDSDYVQSGNTCILSACTGESTQSCTIANGEGHQTRDCITPANQDAYWSDWGTCTATSCDSYYHLALGACVPYICTGNIPGNATICPGQGIQLMADTPRSTVNFCTVGNKCEYQCNNHKVLINGSCVDGNLVFVSSADKAGNLGGALGADAICQNEASANGTNGTNKNFMAWVASGSSSPATRFTKTNINYYLVDGTLVASDWTHLTDGAINNPINKQLNGAPVTSHGSYPNFYNFIWTGTNADGTWNNLNYSGNFCSGYTSIVSGGAGQVGSTTSTDIHWYEHNWYSCAFATFRLYCFAQ